MRYNPLAHWMVRISHVSKARESVQHGFRGMRPRVSRKTGRFARPRAVGPGTGSSGRAPQDAMVLNLSFKGHNILVFTSVLPFVTKHHRLFITHSVRFGRRFSILCVYLVLELLLLIILEVSRSFKFVYVEILAT